MTGAWRFLPPLALAVFALVVGAVVAVSGDTFGYDIAAYWLAARRLLEGEPLYDYAVQRAIGYGVYLYPPPAAAAFIPLALLPLQVASAAWVALMTAATVLAIALLPVSAHVRWLVLLLAGVMWPVSYAIKLGQVTPLLFLAFAAAWRWMDRPLPVAVAGGLGAVLKLQPALLVGWAALTGRWRAFALGVALIAAAVLVTLPLTGLAAYADYIALLGRVAAPLDTPNNVSPGAVAYIAGLDRGAAGLVQAVAMVLTVVLAALLSWRVSPTAGLLAVIVATQLASPVLWTHYAVILLLPIAWLLQRGQWWMGAIPFAMSVPLVGVTPAAVYPVAFALVLVALAASGLPRPVTAVRPIP